MSLGKIGRWLSGLTDSDTSSLKEFVERSKGRIKISAAVTFPDPYTPTVSIIYEAVGKRFWPRLEFWKNLEHREYQREILPDFDLAKAAFMKKEELKEIWEKIKPHLKMANEQLPYLAEQVKRKYNRETHFQKAKLE